MTKVRNVFEELAEKPAARPFGEDVVKVWHEAREIEKKARAFYEGQAKKETDGARKEALLAIAEEENRHIQTIDTMLMYVRYPESFRESQEFKDFRSIEGRQADRS
jgi:rubrerythrin